MTPEAVFAFVAALLAGAPEPRFDPLRLGGHDRRYPVTVGACGDRAGPFEIDQQTVICGTVSVPENPDQPEGRRIPLAFMILRARSEAPAADPLVYLHGGPGAGTLDAGAEVAALFDAHRAMRDIVTFDQRAAGLTSASRHCHAELSDRLAEMLRPDRGADAMDPQATAALMVPCLDEIRSSGADLTQYTTRNSARDVPAVLAALGYADYNLFGISYGTRLALDVLRTAPDGLRAVVLDSVAPPDVRVYDELLVPHADAVDAIVAQCADAPGCAAAYPDLRAAFIALGARLVEAPIPAARGLPALTAADFYAILQGRNAADGPRDVTRFVPRLVHELLAGDTTTLDHLAWRPARPSPEAVLAASDRRLTPAERALALSVLQAAEAGLALEAGTEAAVSALQRALRVDGAVTGVAVAFERRATEAVYAMRYGPEVEALLRDFALLQTRPRTRAVLADWVAQHFEGQEQRVLLDLVSVMTEADLEQTFDIARDRAARYDLAHGGPVNFAIYACQEDFPWNSRDGYDAVVARIAYPFLRLEETVEPLRRLFPLCDAFAPVDVPGFHAPVASDLPVLVMSGLNDTQTSWTWGPRAARTLSRSRTLVFPEAGHGVIAFNACARDISAAFLADPEAPVDARCIERLKPRFVLPGDPLD